MTQSFAWRNMKSTTCVHERNPVFLRCQYDLNVWSAWPGCLSPFTLHYHKWTTSILTAERKNWVRWAWKESVWKTTSSADFTGFNPSCCAQTYSSCRLKENFCWHSMNNLHSIISSLNPFCFPFFSFLQASPTKGFFCSQPTQGTGIMFFSVEKPPVIKSSWKVQHYNLNTGK